RARLATGGGDLLHQGLQLVGAARGQGHACAHGCEQPRETRTQPAGCTGDERDAAVEAETLECGSHHASFTPAALTTGAMRSSSWRTKASKSFSASSRDAMPWSPKRLRITGSALTRWMASAMVRWMAGGTCA